MPSECETVPARWLAWSRSSEFRAKIIDASAVPAVYAGHCASLIWKALIRDLPRKVWLPALAPKSQALQPERSDGESVTQLFGSDRAVRWVKRQCCS